MKEDELKANAAAVIGTDEEILAAGIFGLQDDYAEIFVAGVATGAAGAADGLDSPLAQGAVAGATVHAERDVAARQQGVTRRMLVAVTPTAIHILDRSETGDTTRELMRFERQPTTVQITKFGLSRHLNLADADKHIGLTGSTAPFSAEAAGDKLVLHLLSDPA